MSAIRLLAAPVATSMKPAWLSCDSLIEPLGLDDAKPRLSWQLRDSRDGARQTAYEVEVATKAALLAADKADVWDSGKVASDRSVGVVYAGPELAAEDAVLLAGEGLGQGWEAVSAERGELVGDRADGCRELAGEVDRLRD